MKSLLLTSIELGLLFAKGSLSALAPNRLNIRRTAIKRLDLRIPSNMTAQVVLTSTFDNSTEKRYV